MNREEYALIFDIQRFSLGDGPGIRTVVFFKGCPLHCLWCHNPESQEPIPELLFRYMRCISCLDCIPQCPRDAITDLEEPISIDRGKCDLCGVCVEICPSHALEICGRIMSIEDVLSEVLRDTVFYRYGGVTLSGGEPLYQPSFALRLLKELKKHGIHTVVETCGHVTKTVFEDILGYVDLIYYDLKALDDERHKMFTGVSNKLIISNLEYLAGKDVNLIVRTPVVPGYNFIDLESEICRLIEYVESLGINRLELLPYHRFGEDKYRMLGREYTIRLQPPSIESLRNAIDNCGSKEVLVTITSPILT